MLPIAPKMIIIVGMDNKQTEQNPVELIKNAAEELCQYKKHSYKHKEVFEKYKKKLFILLENYRVLSNDSIWKEINSFQKKLLEVMRTLSATDYFDRFDGRYKPNPNDPHQIQTQSETHDLSLDTQNKLEDEWLCILQEINHHENQTAKPTMGYMSCSDIAEKFGITNKENFRKKLYRYRKKHLMDSELFEEVQNRAANKPKFLYNIKKINPLIKSYKQKQMSDKCPTK